MPSRSPQAPAALSTGQRRTKIHRRFFGYSTSWTSMIFASLAILVIWCGCSHSATTFVSGADVDSTTTTKSSIDTATANSESDANEKDDKDSEFSSLNLNVIELNSRNFDSMVADGNVWLIEFYTPWCRHCQDFATSYSNIAAAFHSSPKEGIRVGRINCSVERSLTRRFGIEGFPSFFLIDGWTVYHFDDDRSVHNLMNFARGGYKKETSIPFFMSPMGPLGMLQAAFIYSGSKLVDLFAWIKAAYGISPIFAGIFLCGTCIFGGLVSIVLFTILTTPSGTHYDDKQD